MLSRRLTRLWIFATAGLVLAAMQPQAVQAQSLPGRLADTTFWRLFTEFSEPSGFFQSDNFVSNEWEMQYEIPAVRARVPGMGAYVGVGPEQNLTYIVAFRPQIAFIVDIRRQNALQHLLYKALAEESVDRTEFLSRLWSRPRPDGLDSTSSPRELIGAFQVAVPDSALYEANLASAFHRLTGVHGFGLTADDSVTLRAVYSAFFAFGPDITYSHRSGPASGAGSGTGVVTRSYTITAGTLDSSVRMITRVDTLALGGGITIRYGSTVGMPSFADLMAADDGHGANHGWLATEANFRVLKDYHTRNLIVPVVGDFGGPKALHAVGGYLREHGTPMSVFYLSNVEQYLFQIGDQWRRFYENVATMPYDSTSTFIRSVTNPRFIQPRHPRSRMAQMSSSVEALIEAFKAGRVAGYYDVVMLLR